MHNTKKNSVYKNVTNYKKFENCLQLKKPVFELRVCSDIFALQNIILLISPPDGQISEHSLYFDIVGGVQQHKL